MSQRSLWVCSEGKTFSGFLSNGRICRWCYYFPVRTIRGFRKSLQYSCRSWHTYWGVYMACFVNSIFIKSFFSGALEITILLITQIVLLSLQVPDYLCCRITLDIFHDPVITPSGLTYERAVILEHLQKVTWFACFTFSVECFPLQWSQCAIIQLLKQVGKFDPITREPLDPSQLVPNLAIKEAVEAFLDKHGWAYKIE